MSNTTISRRTYLQAAGGITLAGITGLAGCSGSSGTGTLATQVKDAPGDISDFESCIVTIEGFWLKASGDDESTATTDGDSTATTDADGVEQQDEEDVDQSDGRTYREFDEPQEADLVQLQDGETQLVDEQEIETGTYAFLQLDVSAVEGTLSGGGDADVGTPGEAPLQFKHAFEVREGQRTTFTADFTPVKRGQTGSYLLQPVATGTEVSYAADTTSTEQTATTE